MYWQCKLKQTRADAVIWELNGYIGLKSNAASSEAGRQNETALVIKNQILCCCLWRTDIYLDSN